ncbi:acyl-ACP--UDP-N-acetylglucosamine O-acyltransferase [Helicobacter saguini]|uniref:Acyl-ACP--UDP-N-acetylglucosamine O-acyltransferase n=1 Tax=Helicobacter saguini TaxID=1548018 RepID=A0A347W6N1_9HELI|nr:acyl-ACP--UDP-N-acetylglucosamine O-acyltransferase [Helicobacter saguini]MWV68382.1 acyl-ACP--UDP-N-acetylglucosamine O-acyltransferase [Helicobacter saguini]MWV70154.1 acyl-ACP--UDP-N-acetylglucosamine O-acyltransferase [Helicobacter saguini]MWV72057.1 acyl-ACP--UDP-N-acetylglucosamine O-acyltransferase [Helicobacter saguini]TLD93719.1 acyl-ACP--UDP-N-acetylglucosamine O-acyltransferase [Helicobacter saguini]
MADSKHKRYKHNEKHNDTKKDSKVAQESRNVKPKNVESKIHIDKAAKVAKTAIIKGNVNIESGVEICDYAVINGTNGDVKIAANAKIEHSATINGNVKIGKNARVGSGAVICGNVEIKENASISNGASIFGNVKISKDSNIANFATIVGDVDIESSVFVGAHSVISSVTHIDYAEFINNAHNMESRNADSKENHANQNSQNLDSKNAQDSKKLQNLDSNILSPTHNPIKESQTPHHNNTKNHITIGANTYIYNNVSIYGDTQIGKNNKIFPNATLGTPPQDLKYNGEKTTLQIGDNNLIRESCMFNPGTQGGGSLTKIGNNNLFMAFVHIAHDCIIGDNNILANNATLGGHIVIENYVNIGGMTPVHQFVKIGEGAMIAGASALSQDIPPYCMAEGNRAKIIGLNRFRMRKIMERDIIDSIDALYKRLFSGEQPLRDLAAMELEVAKSKKNPHIIKICEFILESTRGIPFKRGEND